MSLATAGWAAIEEVAVLGRAVGASRWMIAGMVAAAGIGVPVATAGAAGWPELAALATCNPSDPQVQVQLTENVATGDALVVNCDAEIDLNGYELDVARMAVGAGAVVAVTDRSTIGSGHLVATAAVDGQPGIAITAGATLQINGGTVTATGGYHAAGIGGGADTDGGTVTITSGHVTAVGGFGAAGIGGGYLGDGGATTIIGGTVEATGTERGAGIGGGDGGAGGVTLVEGGTVTATGSQDAAAIGSGDGGGHGGTTTITGGVVNAFGGDDAAGIGAGDEAHGGTVTITDGIVNAYGGDNAAGIGGGDGGGSGATVTISGGIVFAQGGEDGAGIGGGYPGRGGTTTITGGAVEAVGGAGAPGIGPGCGSAETGSITVGAGASVTATGGGASGTCGVAPAIVLSDTDVPGLTVGGTLRLISAEPVALPEHGDSATIQIASTGLITGPADDPTAGSGFSGEGWIDNDGAIAFSESIVGVRVEHHNYVVTFTPASGEPTSIRVFAGSFAAGYRTAPEPSAGNAWAVQGAPQWWHADDTLSGDLTLVEHVTRLVEFAPVGPVTAGSPTQLNATVVDPFLGTVTPQPTLTFTSTNQTDAIVESTLTATQAGTRTVTATDPSSGASASIEVEVVAAPLAELTLTPSATVVAQGGSVTFTATGTDAYDNPVDVHDVVLTSSVPTDVVSGLTVTFPTASPHHITGTVTNVGGATVTATVTIEVVAPDVPTTPPTLAPVLPETGGSAAPIAVVAAVMLAAGVAALAASRRRRTGAAS